MFQLLAGGVIWFLYNTPGLSSTTRLFSLADPGGLFTPWSFTLSRLSRQEYGNDGPLALLALHRDGTEMGLDNPLDNGKT